MKYFTLEDLENTPSRNHKVCQEEEFRCRARAVSFILRCGYQLKLKYTTLCSASIYFHIFYFRRSLKVHDKYDVATACLYFASKCEEDRKRLIEVVETAYYFKFYKKAPNPRLNNKTKLASQEECSKIINKELLLLQTLEFDFDVEQPFDYFTLILNHWKYNKKYLISKGKQKQTQILQFYFKIAWFFVYDSLKLVNIVMNPTEHISIACIELAIRYVYNAFKCKNKQIKNNGHNNNGASILIPENLQEKIFDNRINNSINSSVNSIYNNRQ
eukprot:454870_1